MRKTLIAMGAAVLLLLTACQVNWTSDNGTQGSVSCPPIPTQVTVVQTFSCTGVVSPSSTVLPTTMTPVTTSTSTTSLPSPSTYPTVATTGVSANQGFVEHNGDLTLTQSGSYDRLHVFGSLIVNAPNVHLTNSWVEGSAGTEEAIVNNGVGFTLTDVTIGKTTGCNPQPGIGEHDYTALRVRIQSMGDGFRVSGNNVTATNSYVQTCDDANNHDDGMQAYCPGTTCSNVMFKHNYLSVYGTRNYTAPLFGGSNPGGSNGQLANSVFNDNLLNGGVFSLYLYSSTLQVTNNKIINGHWTYAPIDASSCVGFANNTIVTVDVNNNITRTIGPANCA